VLINGGAQFTSQHSTITAITTHGNGGTIQVEANKIQLTDSTLRTSDFGPSTDIAGSIILNGKNLILTNSRILSLSEFGHGGTIDITTKALHRDASSGIDASSEFGTNGTVTINGVVQP